MFCKLTMMICLTAALTGCSLAVGVSDGSGPGCSYSVRGPGGESLGVAESFLVEQDGMTVQLQGGELTVDGESYGQVPAGSNIEIEPGRVMVNGVERSPVGIGIDEAVRS